MNQKKEKDKKVGLGARVQLKDLKPIAPLTRWDLEVWRASMLGESQLKLPFFDD